MATDSPLPIGYTDSDWGGPLTGNRRSVSGYVFKLAGAPVMWRSQIQKTVALSSNESEYMAASDSARDGLWLRNLIRDIQLPQYDLSGSSFPPLQLWLDNAGAQCMANDTFTTKRAKHVDVRYHFLRLNVNDGLIAVHHCPTTEQAADGLTKPLRYDGFQRFIRLAGLTTIAHAMGGEGDATDDSDGGIDLTDLN